LFANPKNSNYQLKSVGNFKNDPQEDIGDSFVGAGFGEQGYSPQDKTDTNHIGMGFTTKDRDNDGYEYGNCGREDGSGWWFNRCSAVNLNGKHYGTGRKMLFNVFFKNLPGVLVRDGQRVPV